MSYHILKVKGLGKPISCSANDYGGRMILFEKGFIWCGREGDSDFKVYEIVEFNGDDM